MIETPTKLPNNKKRIGELTFAELLVYEKNLLSELEFLQKNEPANTSRIDEIEIDLQNIGYIKEIAIRIESNGELKKEFFDKIKNYKGG